MYGTWTGVHSTRRLDYFIVFFFQAEDGIRDIGVTGVQTCALPIWKLLPVPAVSAGRLAPRSRPALRDSLPPEIGRASCRERVYISVDAVSLKKIINILTYTGCGHANLITHHALECYLLIHGNPTVA